MLLRLLFLTGLALANLAYAEPSKDSTQPRVLFETSMGPITIELYPERAPVTVANFLEYVNSGFYDGTIFHRVVPGFVVQGGGFDQRYQQKPNRKPIINEAGNGLANRRGTLSMARTADPNSATSQFFINLTTNRSLDRGPGGAGYAVFGEIVDGMNIVDQMVTAPQGKHAGVFANAPNQPISIVRAQVLAAAKPSTAKPSSAKPSTANAPSAEPVTTAPPSEPVPANSK